MKELQTRIKAFTKNHNLESPIEHRVLDTVSEIGEVAKEVLKMTDYGREEPQYRKELSSELGDVLYSLITIANTYDIDLEDSLENALKKYMKRLERGSAGSEND
jgi:NTP pyrophosphatase (non-canonical NTP hydrolase)